MLSDRAVFVHYPKAGGTSILTQLQAALGERMLVYVDVDIFGNPGPDRAPFPPEKQLVTGHFKATRYADTDATMATFLRHPVDGLLSWYFYWLQHDYMRGPYHAEFIRTKPTITEFARMRNYAVSMSEVFFGGFDMSRFDFVGFHERREQDIPLLGETLGVPLSPDVKLNPTAANLLRDEIQNDPVILSELRDVLRADIDFYETAFARWS